MQSSIISVSKELRDIVLILAYCILLFCMSSYFIAITPGQGPNFGLLSHEMDNFALTLTRGHFMSFPILQHYFKVQFSHLVWVQ